MSLLKDRADTPAINHNHIVPVTADVVPALRELIEPKVAACCRSLKTHHPLGVAENLGRAGSDPEGRVVEKRDFTVRHAEGMQKIEAGHNGSFDLCYLI